MECTGSDVVSVESLWLYHCIIHSGKMADVVKAKKGITGHSEKSMTITSNLIAPCGMNCRLCRAYIREKKACPGCYGNDNFMSKSTATCCIRNCETIKTGKAKYCFACTKFPCANLNHLDKRYRTKYGMSMIDNLESIKQFGMTNFTKREKVKWACSICGDIICVHKEKCISCGYAWR